MAPTRFPYRYLLRTVAYHFEERELATERESQ